MTTDLPSRLGAALHRRRRAVLAAWGAFVLACLLMLALDPRAPAQTESTGATSTEAHQVMLALRDDFGLRAGNELALVLPATPEAERAALRARLSREFRQIEAIRELRGRRDPALRLWLLQLDPAVDFVAAQRLVPAIRAVCAQTGRPAYLTGNVAFYADIAHESERFMSGAEAFGMAAAFVVLLATFGGLTPALLPIAMGGATLLALAAALRVTGLDSTPMADVLCGLLGMALAIDYALFIVSRYQEELDGGAEPEAALATTLRHAGETIGVSAAIVLASILVLLIPEVTGTRIMARNLAIVVLLSVAHALFVLPALLALARPTLGWPEALGRRVRAIDRHRHWRRFGEHVTARPWRYMALSLGLVLALAAPVAGMRLWDPVQTLASAQSESRRGYELLRADGWGGRMVPVIVLVRDERGGRIDSDEGLAAIHGLARAIAAHPDVAGVQSLPAFDPRLDRERFIRLHRTLAMLGGRGGLDAEGRTHMMLVFPRDVMRVEQSRRIVDHVRAYARAHPERRILAGGVVERARDFTDELYRHTPLMVALVLAGIFALLFAYMRALLLPVKAGLMNFVPILGAFGVLTLVFQAGWLQGLLHTPANGAVTSVVPITLFCIVFGLSMDYEVLILSRISEAWRATGDPREAVVEGMARSGAVITSAALIFLAVFLPAIASPSPAVQELGIGIVAAILIDATLVRLLLVPSFMVLMGRWNWWSPLGRPGSAGRG